MLYYRQCMEKDFFGWTRVKQNLNAREQGPFFNEREVWWCSVGVNIGHEQDGKDKLYTRPVLVFRKFNQHVFWAIPLTTKEKKDERFYVEVPLPEGTSYLILSQLRLMSSKRLTYKMKKLSKRDFTTVVERVRALLPEM
jgi:mRNA interferase MazF